MPENDWLAAVRAADGRALARAVSVVESRGPEAEALLRALFPASGQATLIGVTGAPGAGKSTLVDQLAREYRRSEEKVGIIAVDPSSSFSHGAILGDRIRMQAHFGDPGIFIRSMATRGSLGGLAAATADAATVLDAAGCRRVVIETVGVGQGEVDIVQLADVVLVVLVPGMGDEVQTLKAGILEIADVFVVNKADRGADRLVQELRAMLSLAKRADGWRPAIVQTVATEARGIVELREAIAAFEHYTAAEGRLAARRRRQWHGRLERLLRDRWYESALAPRLAPAALEQAADAVSERRTDPYSAAESLIAAARPAP
ncbi:MAG: methylmalonyl Co-A mutase-associated GTPase MeaB [Terriglobales bacterium]